MSTRPEARILELAKDMVSYIHHSGYPSYDGGHSEPESTCEHPDCVLIRNARINPTRHHDELVEHTNTASRALERVTFNLKDMREALNDIVEELERDT